MDRGKERIREYMGKGKKIKKREKKIGQGLC